MTSNDAIKFDELMQSLSVLFPSRVINEQTIKEYFAALEGHDIENIQKAAKAWKLQGRRFPYVSDLVSFM